MAFDRLYDQFGNGRTDYKSQLKRIYANPGNYSSAEIRKAYSTALSKPGRRDEEYYDNVGSDDDDYVFRENRYSTAVNSYNIGLQDLLLRAGTGNSGGGNTKPKPQPANPDPLNIDPKRGTGDFGDIKDSLKSELSTAQKSVSDTRNKQVAPVIPSNTKAIESKYQAQIADLQKAFNTRYQGLENSLLQQQTQFSQTNSRLAQQLKASQAAYQQQALQFENSRAAFQDTFAARQAEYQQQLASYQNKYKNAISQYELQLGDYQNQLGAAQSAYNRQMQEFALRQQGYEQQLGAAQTAYEQQQQEFALRQQDYQNQLQTSQQAYALQQQELQASQNAYNQQVQLAQNLQNAYVPPAEQSAVQADTGDQRQVTQRKAANNSLSSLSILSGLGTNANPLAGLQLA